MKINLSSFEEEIDPLILERGFEYWETGAVSALSREKDGMIIAKVRGTRSYRVEIRITGDVVAFFSCTCPFDYGPVCKHIAAVLYALLNGDSTSEGTGGDDISGGEESGHVKLSDILASLSKKELIELVMRQAAIDEICKNKILCKFARPDSAAASAVYEKLLDAGIAASEDRSGFIEYRQAGAAADVALDLLNEGEEALDREEYGKTFEIARSVIMKMYEAMLNADDSDGEIGGAIDQALDLLEHLGSKSLPGPLRKKILAFMQDKKVLKKLSDFNWEWDLLRIGVQLVSTDDEERELLHAADGMISDTDDWSTGYDEEQRALLELSLYESRKTAEETESFMRENIRFSSFRRIVIDRLFERNEYEKLLEVARAGIEQDQNASPGYAREWCEWILRAAQKAGDISTVRDTAETLFHLQYEMSYFRILKSAVPPGSWQEKRERLITAVDQDETVKREIYSEEGLTERLWESVIENPSLDLLERYEDRLFDRYRDAMIDHYTQLIPDFLERRTGRTNYADVCRTLLRLKKRGESEWAARTARLLLERFKNRPALRDEIGRHGLSDNQNADRRTRSSRSRF